MWRGVYAPVSALLLVVTLGTFGVPAGAKSAQSDLQAKALSISDMPSGWTKDRSPQAANLSSLGGCLRNSPPKKPAGLFQVAVAFGLHSLPALEEVLDTGKTAQTRYDKSIEVLSNCTTVRITRNGKTFTCSVDPMTFPAIADSSSAYSISLTAEGVSIDIDIIYFRLGNIYGSLSYENFSPAEGTLEDFVDEAVSKVEGSPIKTAVSS